MESYELSYTGKLKNKNLFLTEKTCGHAASLWGELENQNKSNKQTNNKINRQVSKQEKSCLERKHWDHK